MITVKAAVVSGPGKTPRYGTVELSEPNGAEQEIVQVLAVGVHPRTRSGAAGTHYTSSGSFPAVPGIVVFVRRLCMLYFEITDIDQVRGMKQRVQPPAQ